MSYKVTISDGTVLQECIENVTFNVDAPKDYNSWNTNVRKSIRITGKIDTDESTISLYNWALLPATNKDCYKEITVEEYRKNILVRKVHFSKAFVAQYSENYSNSNGVGTFTLYVKQLFNNEIEVTDKETASNSSAADTPSNTPEEPVQEVKKEALVSTVLPFKKKHQKITDKLAKGNKMPDNNITVVEYGEHFTKDGRKKVLKPNVQYTTPEGYTYKTDELGRIISCEGTLKKGKGTSSTLKSLGNKTEQYVTKRGWTWDSMDDVVKKPYTTREAINKATGNPATAYYNKAGDYVVVDNVTGELVQVSKFGDTGWIPDATIKNPYKPWEGVIDDWYY